MGSPVPTPGSGAGAARSVQGASGAKAAATGEPAPGRKPPPPHVTRGPRRTKPPTPPPPGPSHHGWRPPAAKPQERHVFDTAWKRALWGLSLLTIVWVLNFNHLWAQALAVSCILSLAVLFILFRGRESPRVSRRVGALLVTAVLVGSFLAAGGWAYTYGAGEGLALLLEAPAGPVPHPTGEGLIVRLNYSFVNTGPGRLRFNPDMRAVNWGSVSPSLSVLDSNGTFVTEGHIGTPFGADPPLGGFTDMYVELGPGQSWHGAVDWWEFSGDPGAPAGNYTGRLLWYAPPCGYSGLPCVAEGLRSDNVTIQLV